MEKKPEEEEFLPRPHAARKRQAYLKRVRDHILHMQRVKKRRQRILDEEETE